MSVIETAVNFAINVANDNSHGYSQDAKKRWLNPDVDCSSLVILSFRNAGLPLTSTFTGDMRMDFLNNGFKDVTSSVSLSSGSGLQRGDVLLNEAKHTAIYIGDGRIVHASSSETGGKYGKSGDQTGGEVCTRSYYNYPWGCVLRYMNDSDKGDKTVMIELPVLKEGSKGEEVKTVQRLLNSFGYKDQNNSSIPVDGSYGSRTAYVVRKFQNDYRGKFGRLTVDGVVGANTWNALLK